MWANYMDSILETFYNNYNSAEETKMNNETLTVKKIETNIWENLFTVLFHDRITWKWDIRIFNDEGELLKIYHEKTSDRVLDEHKKTDKRWVWQALLVWSVIDSIYKGKQYMRVIATNDKAERLFKKWFEYLDQQWYITLNTLNRIYDVSLPNKEEFEATWQKNSISSENL